jgi:hypothetical protein
MIQPYIINLLMFLPVPFLSMLTIWHALRNPNLPFRPVWILFSISTGLMPLAFVAAQLLWIVGERDQVMPLYEVLIWIFHDYANAVHYLSGSALAYLMARWFGVCPRIKSGRTCPK